MVTSRLPSFGLWRNHMGNIMSTSLTNVQHSFIQKENSSTDDAIGIRSHYERKSNKNVAINSTNDND